MGKITKKYQAEMLRRIYSIGLIAFALTPIAAYAASINDMVRIKHMFPGLTAECRARCIVGTSLRVGFAAVLSLIRIQVTSESRSK